jgi:predicted esterase YcpF (UPF0227 family)
MTLIYIHGFLSNSDKKVEDLSYMFPNATVLGFNYTCETLDEDLGRMRLDLIDAIERDPETILIGTSLGSLITNYLSQTIPVKTILINPVPNIKDILYRLIGTEQKNYVTFKYETVTNEFFQFVTSIRYEKSHNATATIIGRYDDVIGDVNAVAKQFQNVTFIESGHRVNVLDHEDLLNKIINTINI